MEIFVYRRPDGSEWADFTCRGEVIRKIQADTADELKAVIARERGRVKALAERALLEIVPIDPVTHCENRGLWGRLKWLFAGR